MRSPLRENKGKVCVQGASLRASQYKIIQAQAQAQVESLRNLSIFHLQMQVSKKRKERDDDV